VVEKIDPNKSTVYELPLSEKFRTFIRLESLFDEIEFYLKGNSSWDSRASVKTFIDIVNVFSRPEIKTDLMKEMDRIKAALSKYTEISGVNADRLVEIQTNLVHMAKNLRAMEGQVGQSLKQNDFINSLHQRNNAPGGALVMDLPIYGHWMGQDIKSRRSDVRMWLKEFSLVKQAVYLILNLVRDSALAVDVVAKAGFYQHTLDTDLSNQVLRVILQNDTAYFPEISGGKHRFTVRFLKPMNPYRPVQIEQDVPFKLICCVL